MLIDFRIRDTTIPRIASSVLERTHPHALCMISVRYLVVEADTSYNVLISRPTLNTLGAIVSTPHLVKKFPSSDDEVGGDQAPRKGNISAHVEISTGIELDPKPPID
ncbi:hypothetical protein CR513_42916, partial [Mucuna pruriens]